MITDREAMAVSKKFPPHIKHPDSVRTLTADVLIALMPAAFWAIYAFGARALSIMLVSVISAVVSEIIFDVALKRQAGTADLTSVVTGVLLAFCMPSTVPLYVPLLGSAFAVVIVKCVFGGVGCNILNPALAGAVFVRLCFPSAFVVANDPLAILKAGELPQDSLFDMVVGNIPGNIGEVSALLLIAGGVYLWIRGTIDWCVPVSYIACVAVMTFMLPQNANSLGFAVYEVLSGALILAAIFMATDPVTTPVKRIGRIVFGVMCGVLTVLIRYYSGETEGVMYAILTMNLVSPVIDRLTAMRLTISDD